MDLGIAYRPMPGETECGDGYLVREHSGGILLAVVDGLGHGPEAAVAARAATDILDAHSAEDIGPLVRRCHQGLRDLRGVVLGIAYIDTSRDALTWLSIGNILGLLVHTGSGRKREKTFMVSHSGLVGQRLPPVKAETRPIAPGDLLVFATDGIRPEFPEALGRTVGPQELAERLLRDYAVDTDDALVLVVCYRRGAGEPGPATLL
jgi:phosphoserine phosphatase RsbX